VGNAKCLDKLLDQYLEKLPPDAPFLYMQPLEKVLDDSKKAWYTLQRVGFNTLKGFVIKIFSGTGIDCDYTNHSLRATSITRMFTSQVPEKIIAEKSGYRSLTALRSYEYTSWEQDRAAGRAIVSNGLDADSKSSVASMATMNPLQMDADTKQSEDLFKAAFSGKMENCTFNFYFNK